LNDANPIQEQNSNPRSVAKNSISGDKSPPKQQETTLEENFDEKTIDLNELFPDAETDLNGLFPDNEVKDLLKNIIKNKKDMGLIKKRLATENETTEESKEKKTPSIHQSLNKTGVVQTNQPPSPFKINFPRQPFCLQIFNH